MRFSFLVEDENCFEKIMEDGIRMRFSFLVGDENFFEKIMEDGIKIKNWGE